MLKPGNIKLSEARASLFDYDISAPLNPTTVNSFSDESSRVQEVQYHNGGRIVSAFRVDPLFTLPIGRVLFLHSAKSNKSSFLPDAKALAGRGVTSLLIDAPWAEASFQERAPSMSPEEMRKIIIDTTIDLRRGADLLTASRAGANVAFVGHSIGAMVGGILSAVDKRFRALVLLAGVGHFSDLARLNANKADDAWTKRYRDVMSDIDPGHYVSTARFASFLFQLGLEDRMFPRAKFVEYYEVAGGNRDLIWYEADHFGLNEKGSADRIEWLDVQLQTI
jgi:pimeloyl-ACP methyl ester carboxylesterase